MTERELKRRFPNASAAFIKQNSDDNDSGVCAVQSKPIKRVPLDLTPEREETCWHDADAKFAVSFFIHSSRPCDWDGYDIKALQDFLVTAGILPDDGWKIVSGRVYSLKAATKDEEKTVIEVRQL